MGAMEALVQSLEALRQDEGLSTRQIREHPFLIQMLEVRSPEECVEKLRILARSLGDSKYAQAIRNALAIDVPIGKNVTDRRERIIASAPGHQPALVASRRTLFRWEDEGIKELAKLILEQSTYEAKGDLEGRPIQQTIRAEKPYMIVAEDAFYSLNDAGVMIECQNSFSVRALQPSVKGFTRTVTYEADKRPGVIKVEPRMGCRVVTLEESDAGAVKLFAEFDRVLSPDDPEPYTFSYATKIESKTRAYPIVAYQTVTTRTRLSTIHVKFSDPTLPQSIWWFACPSLLEVTQPRPDRTFEPSESGYYFHRFDNIVPQWLYGIAWTWSD